MNTECLKLQQLNIFLIYQAYCMHRRRRSTSPPPMKVDRRAAAADFQRDFSNCDVSFDLNFVKLSESNALIRDVHKQCVNNLRSAQAMQ